MLKAIIAKLEDVDENLRQFYTEGSGSNEGKFILQVTPVGDFALEDIGGLKRGLESSRTEFNAAKKQLAAYKGLDVDKATAALAKVEEMKNWKPDDEVAAKVEAIKSELVTQHTTKESEWATREARLRGELESHLVDNIATAEITKLGGAAALLLPHVKRHVKVDEVDGEFVAQVLNDKGDVRIGDTQGTPMTIGQLVEEMSQSDTYAMAFTADNKGGTGSKNSSTQNNNTAGKPYSVNGNDPEAMSAAADDLRTGKAVLSLD